MLRLLFEKKGNSVWISHLDLMRLFQRAFKRAGLRLTHTQGYNPRPSVSIALPLSVGVESACELLDFEIENLDVSCQEIREKLNGVLIDGIKVLNVYTQGKKLKELAFLKCRLVMEYDGGVPENVVSDMVALFQREELPVEKKSKNGITQQNIIPMIQTVSVWQEGSSVLMDAVICCQNPSLNPMQLAAAVERYLPDMAPDFVRCCRMEIYDRQHEVFR